MKKTGPDLLENHTPGSWRRVNISRSVIITTLCTCCLFAGSARCQEWHALGSGLGNWDYVYQMKVWEGDVYICGYFQDVGGDPDADCLARWDGCDWHAVAPMQFNGLAYLNAMAITDQRIYIGGNFSDVGGNPDADNFAYWDGQSWQTLGGGLGINRAVVSAIEVVEEKVYVAGSILHASGGYYVGNFVKYWDGFKWYSIGNGISNQFMWFTSLAVQGDDLYLSGAGDSGTAGVRKWNGNFWSTLNSGPGTNVSDLLFAPNGDLFTCGIGTKENWTPCSVASWDGTNWNSIGLGGQDCSEWYAWSWGPIPLCMAIGSHNELIIGGNFSQVDDVPHTADLAVWDGNSWSAIGAPDLDPDLNFVYDIAVDGDDIYIAGYFPGVGNTPNTAGIARWGRTRNPVALPAILDTICKTDAPLALPTTINGLHGFWSGDQTDGNAFVPTGEAGTFPLTFTPDPGQCADEGTTAVAVVPCHLGIYPNPNSGSFTVEVENTDENVVLELYDKLGRLVTQQHLRGTIRHQIIIQVPAAAYTAVLKTNTRRHVTKLVVVN